MSAKKGRCGSDSSSSSDQIKKRKIELKEEEEQLSSSTERKRRLRKQNLLELVSEESRNLRSRSAATISEDNSKNKDSREERQANQTLKSKSEALKEASTEQSDLSERITEKTVKGKPLTVMERKDKQPKACDALMSWVNPFHNNQTRNYERAILRLKMLREVSLEVTITELSQLEIKTVDELSKIAEFAFRRAIINPYWTRLYAELVQRLNPFWRITVTNDGIAIDLIKVMSQKCKLLFYKKIDVIIAEFKGSRVFMTDQMINDKVRDFKAGNLRFIGELFNRELLDYNIILLMINKWLQEPNGEAIAELCFFYRVIANRLEDEGRRRKMMLNPNVSKSLKNSLSNSGNYLSL